MTRLNSKYFWHGLEHVDLLLLSMMALGWWDRKWDFEPTKESIKQAFHPTAKAHILTMAVSEGAFGSLSLFQKHTYTHTERRWQWVRSHMCESASS